MGVRIGLDLGILGNNRPFREKRTAAESCFACQDDALFFRTGARWMIVSQGVV